MQTHSDEDAFGQRLRERARGMVRDRQSEITTGRPGEEELASWVHGDIHVHRLPDDEQGILRISIGGGVKGRNIDYCVFRGSRERCIKILSEALDALRNPPPREA